MSGPRRWDCDTCDPAGVNQLTVCHQMSRLLVWCVCSHAVQAWMPTFGACQGAGGWRVKVEPSDISQSPTCHASGSVARTEPSGRCSTLRLMSLPVNAGRTVAAFGVA